MRDTPYDHNPSPWGHNLYEALEHQALLDSSDDDKFTDADIDYGLLTDAEEDDR